MSSLTETVLVMAAVAVACSGLGVFLVLRRLAMTADAIGHTLLLGIVVAFAIVRDLRSPWLAIGAAMAGIITVWLVEWLQRIGRIRQDAAIGLVFPVLFALGTLLASLEFRQIHLDVDAVLLGQAENTRLSRWEWGRIDVPSSFATCLLFAVASWSWIGLFLKELSITTFDADLSVALGYRPGLIHLTLVSLASITAVAAFDAVGPLLVVSFFVVPAATARLLTNRLSTTLIGSLLIGLSGAVGGTWLAFQIDTTVAGTVASLLGLVFFIVAFGTAIIRRSR